MDFTDFGSVATEGGTMMHTFRISNYGTAALTLDSVTVSGTHAGDFSVTTQPAASVNLASSTSFEITFNPTSHGLRSATLSLTNNDSEENPFTFKIQGTGLNSAPTAIELNGTNIAENNGANATVGTLSATDVDPGDVPTFSLVSGDGSTDNASFNIAGTTLKLTMTADFETKSSYAIRIGVNDGKGGTFESPFTITILNQPESMIAVAGNGAGIASGDTSPAPADNTDFGNVALANTQVTHTFTIRNTGDRALNLTGSPRVRISGSAASDFKVIALPASPLSPDTGTDFAITFDPSLPGVRGAQVTIANDDLFRSIFAFTIQGFGELSTPLAQTITFTAPSAVYFAQSPLPLTATASSGLPVSFTLVSAPFGTTLKNGILTYTTAGTVKVQAIQEGGGNYAAAKPVTLSLALKDNPSALTLTQLNQKYDGDPKPIRTEGGVGDVVITYTVNGSSTATPPISAGTYAVKAVAGTATKAGKLVITKAPLYVTPDDQRKFVGQDNPELNATYTGFIWPDTAEVMTPLPVLSTPAKATSPGGAYPIKASGGSALNYAFVYRQGTLVVESFAGTYEALLSETDLPIAKLSITVAAAGTFSGKLFTATETAALPLKGSLTTDVNEVATGTCFVSKNSIPYAITFTLSMDGTVIANVTRDSVLLGSSNNGRKLLQFPKGQTASYAGAHTAIFEPATTAEATVPAGAGWATATISKVGIITLAGRLGDGTAFTSGVAPDGESNPGYRLFVQPYLPARMQSYMGGQFRLKAHPDASLPGRRYLNAASMKWTKAGRPADASYRVGFGPVTTVLAIDSWQKPTASRTLATLLGLGETRFGITHSATGSLAHDGSLPTTAELSATNMVTALLPVSNTTKWKAKLVPATGTFTGSFLLRDDTPAVTRTVPFSGVLRQPPAAVVLPGTIIGDGHYLLPPLSGTEKVSGGVSFTRP